jgi:predicted nucleic acid-binding Zn ribbon protein
MGVMATPGNEAPIVLTAEQKRRQRARSIAIALMLAALVVMFYLVTILRLGGNVFNRPI